MTPRDPQFRQKTAAALVNQPFARLLDFEAGEVSAGVFEVVFVAAEKHLQHDRFVHGGVTATVADTCLALAALTLVAPGERVLTIEFKTNFLRPISAGERVRCRGEVIRPGRAITASEARVFASLPSGEERLVATASGTVATVS